MFAVAFSVKTNVKVLRNANGILFYLTASVVLISVIKYCRSLIANRTRSVNGKLNVQAQIALQYALQTYSNASVTMIVSTRMLA